MMFCIGQYHKLWPTHLNSGQTCLNEKATSTKQPHARIKKKYSPAIWLVLLNKSYKLLHLSILN